MSRRTSGTAESSTSHDTSDVNVLINALNYTNYGKLTLDVHGKRKDDNFAFDSKCVSVAIDGKETTGFTVGNYASKKCSITLSKPYCGRQQNGFHHDAQYFIFPVLILFSSIRKFFSSSISITFQRPFCGCPQNGL